MFKFLQLMLVAAVMIMSTAVYAWPTKPVTLIIPYPPGGGADQLARLIREDLSRKLGQPVVINYAPGGGGLIAMREVISSQDDHKFLFTTTDLVVAASVVHSNFNAADLPVVSILSQSTLILATRPNGQFNNFQSVIDHLGTGSVSFGSPGIGSTSHLVLEKLLQSRVTDPIIVHYRGGNPMAVDTIGGHHDLSISGYGGSFRPYISSGQLVPVVSFSDRRLSELPNVPTAKESGIDIVASISWSVFANTALSTDQIEKFNRALAVSLNKPQTKAELSGVGNEILALSVEESTQFFDQEVSTWSKTIVEVNQQTNK